jgi:hypothetical protein
MPALPACVVSNTLFFSLPLEAAKLMHAGSLWLDAVHANEIKYEIHRLLIYRRLLDDTR